MKKCYRIMIIIGAIATLLYIVSIWASPVWDVILNVIAMLGSGVFCSAIVSYFIDKQHELMILQKQLDSQRFIYADIINEICFLISREIKYVSMYLKKKKIKKEYKETLSLDEAIKKIQELLITITKSDLTKITKQKKEESTNLLCNFTLDNYKSLQKKIFNIISDGSFYLNLGVLNEKKLYDLKDLEKYLEFIILSENEYNISIIVNNKLEFFQKLFDFCNDVVIINAITLPIID